MPEVSAVFSLYSHCLYTIQDNLEHIYRPTPKVKSVNKRRKLETGSSCSISETTEEGESDNNPFHKIRKSRLRRLFNEQLPNLYIMFLFCKNFKSYFSYRFVGGDHLFIPSRKEIEKFQHWVSHYPRASKINYSQFVSL
jgi:hypothetical protein